MKQNAGSFKAAVFSVSLFLKMSPYPKSISDSFSNLGGFTRDKGRKGVKEQID